MTNTTNEQLNTCQHCGTTVTYGETEHGFPGFVHEATGTTVCPAHAVGALMAAVETAAQTLATEVDEQGHPTVEAYGEVIDVNEAIDDAMTGAEIPAMQYLHLTGPVIARADEILAKMHAEPAEPQRRPIVSVGWDGRSEPMWRYADELDKADHLRTIVAADDLPVTAGSLRRGQRIHPDGSDDVRTVQAVSATYDPDLVHVLLNDGRTVSVPPTSRFRLG